MAVYTDEKSGCSCARIVCDYGCQTYASKMIKQLKENLSGVSSSSQYVKGKYDDSTTFAGNVNAVKIKLTNADHIRAMTDAELANWYFDKFFPCVPYCSMLQDGCPEHDDCKICLLDWLKQESEKPNDKTN